MHYGSTLQFGVEIQLVTEFPPASSISRASVSVQWFLSQSTGGRGEQQDASVVLVGANSQHILAVVADGAGGHSGGREAAITVTDVTRQLFHEAGGAFGDPEAALANLCLQSHEAINDLGPDPKTAPRSTVVALYLCDNRTWWAHVGDSRLYRVHKGRIVERTRDHTMAQILLEQGEIGEADVGKHPDRIKLLRALGGEDAPKPAFGNAAVSCGDSFLLCSDGLWENLKPREIERTFAGRPSQRSLDKLVSKADARNGERGDNVTACAVIMGPSQQGNGAGGGLAMVGLTALAGTLLADRAVKSFGRWLKR